MLELREFTDESDVGCEKVNKGCLKAFGLKQQDTVNIGKR